jgi:hypothetical protein
MFFTAMNTYVGNWATDLTRVLIVTSLFAALLAFHNAITRYTYALASEGALPRQLGRIHPVHKSPYIAGLADSPKASWTTRSNTTTETTRSSSAACGVISTATSLLPVPEQACARIPQSEELAASPGASLPPIPSNGLRSPGSAFIQVKIMTFGSRAQA